MHRSCAYISRQETIDIFYHGFDGYMEYAFPEDELRPLSCTPLTRDRHNPAHIEVNDVLGNYSLTLIDSLSTLAILASSPPPAKRGRNRPLDDFQDGVKALVDNYGDGSEGQKGQGRRARGFDLDSKVQVFETVIRGVGGLLSAHQFAIGDLPIRGYHAKVQKKNGNEGIYWKNGFVYDGQLLRLATDLADRLMPAFHTPTGLPYPRVNLRHGVPFYANSPYNNDAEHGQCAKDSKEHGTEITETCSAGAGSLVLEFTTLSRLTGDMRFEIAAKDAFWAVWSRRSTIGLIGAGIDAETGQWVSPYTGVGAGIDSFFEYALKSHILLSGLPYDPEHAHLDSADAFLRTWQDAQGAIKRQIYRGPQHQHPHYFQVDLYTGAMRAFWIDSLSAFYQGTLTMAGELEEAIETHLLHTALWTRYSAMPERWSTATGNIEGGLRWWPGRPEFIESNWYLYQATKDPWYLYVAEMIQRDIKRRCWTKCGWAGLHDVRSGELSDRMESFFLGETAKYLFLTFDPSHPLNTWDAPYVFTTEGHPLIIPKRLRASSPATRITPDPGPKPALGVCPLPPARLPFSISATAARSDIFHAASLARLHLMPTRETLDSPLVEFSADHPSISVSDIQSPSNYTYYPWTLPPELVPQNATSSKMTVRATFDLSFPNLPSSLQTGTLQRVHEGILVNSMSGVRLGMVREPEHFPLEQKISLDEQFRIYAISNVALGRDEKVYMSRSTIDSFNPTDPFFTRTRDAITVDLVIDVPPEPTITPSSSSLSDLLADSLDGMENISNLEVIELDVDEKHLENGESYLSSLLHSLQALLAAPSSSSTSAPSASGTKKPQTTQRLAIQGTLPLGPGSVPLPDVPDPDLSYSKTNVLSWSTIYIHPNTLCEERLPIEIPKTHHIIVIPRGDCSFSAKLRNIPAFPPSSASLQIVVIVSYTEHEEPHYEFEASGQADKSEEEQAEADKVLSSTRDRGIRKHTSNIGSPKAAKVAKDSNSVAPDGRKLASKMFSKKSPSSSHSEAPMTYNLVQPLLDEVQYTPSGIPRPHPIPLIMVSGGDETIALLRRATAIGVRRRYYFSSQGVRINNLIVL